MPPIFGDKLFPYNVSDSIGRHQFNPKLQLLIGHTEMEGLKLAQITDQYVGLGGRYTRQSVLAAPTSVTKQQVASDIRKLIPPGLLCERDVRRIVDEYTRGAKVGGKRNSGQLLVRSCYMAGDIVTTCLPVLFGSQLIESDSFRRTGGNIYGYKLSYTPSTSKAYGSRWARTDHDDDVPLMFGQPFYLTGHRWTADDRKMSSAMLKIWTDFAKYGKPEPSNSSGHQWPKYEINRSNGAVNVSYVELNPLFPGNRAIRLNRYRGHDGYIPNVLHNCLGFWRPLLSDNYQCN
ncbi:acetylcholinesterase-like [Oppia nitens]|uniref:acetylcholinesterase-like n=1 Tax=Oppia nitens TaxID=1686743 RepID=UPI0023DC0B59|nr:acetylcholinesterase-like [Oppia nitens]